MKKLLILMLLLVITGCNKSDNIKEPNKVPEKNNNNNAISNINRNSKYQEEKIIEGLSFNNATLVSIDETALFEVKVKNTNASNISFDHIKITLLDKDNKKLQELIGMVTNGINAGEEKIISCYFNGKINDIFDVKYEIIK